MNHPERPTVRVSSTAGMVATVPNLIGFTPENSLVVIGLTAGRGQIELAIRYDLPGVPADIAAHAIVTLSNRFLAYATVIGYGPDPLVTPAANAVREALSPTGIGLHDVLRVHEGRYWSYVCQDPGCCPPEGVPFDAAAHPAARALDAKGMSALPSRAALAETIAPVTGPQADEMALATRRAEQRARRTPRSGRGVLAREGLPAVTAAIEAYRGGNQISPGDHAWLALVVTRCLPVRDDAWARMVPAHRQAHRRMWTDLVRHAQPGYAAAPASLLAFTAWQCGEGALANLALDRAVADTPGYSMATLLLRAIEAGMPPSLAVPPLTPEEVAASYALDN
jgi:hypothetical protein